MARERSTYGHIKLEEEKSRLSSFLYDEIYNDLLAKKEKENSIILSATRPNEILLEYRILVENKIRNKEALENLEVEI